MPSGELALFFIYTIGLENICLFIHTLTKHYVLIFAIFFKITSVGECPYLCSKVILSASINNILKLFLTFINWDNFLKLSILFAVEELVFCHTHFKYFYFVRHLCFDNKSKKKFE